MRIQFNDIIWLVNLRKLLIRTLLFLRISFTTFHFIFIMAVLASSFAGLRKPKSTTPKLNHDDSDEYALSTVFVFIIYGVLLVMIIIFCYCVFYICYNKNRQKRRRQSIHPRNISPVYVIPNAVPEVIEEPPPSYYSIVQTQERESNSTAHF
jgi:heme/copper-type cytochrome/quinol oxidase subunit 2